MKRSALLFSALVLLSQLPRNTWASDPVVTDPVVTDPYANVRSVTLANGLKVVLAPSTDAKTFQIKVSVNAGQLNDEPGKAGVAHLLEHYLFTDAKLEKDMTYLEAIKERGGSANATTYLKSTIYFATVPAPLAPWLVDVFGKIVFEKDFDSKRVEHAKGPVFLEIGRPTIFDYVIEAVQRVWPDFASEPDAWQTEFGIREPVFKISAPRLDTARLTSDDLKGFYDRFYHPKNITVFLAGKIDPALVALAGKRFGTEPSRDGSGWVDPTPRARLGQYFRSAVTSLVPSIDVGTKVTGISPEDEIVGRIYIEYLAHRLMKDLRNKRGETYTARTDVNLRKGSGFLSVRFEAPRETYSANLKLVEKMIEDEARQGAIDEKMFQEAKSLYLKPFTRFDRDSGSMMHLADRLDYLERNYALPEHRSADYAFASSLTREEFIRRLKPLFREEMKATELHEPPLFFRFEWIVLTVLAFGIGMRVCRKVFAKNFPHDEIRWVRKFSYPPAYLLQIGALSAIALASAVLYGGMYALWVKVDLLQKSYLLSDYLLSGLWLGLTLIVGQCILGLFPRKAMIVRDALWLKSLGLWSATVPLSGIQNVQLCSPAGLALSPRLWFKIKYRYFFYDPCFLRKGILIELNDGRSYFMGLRSPASALLELERIRAKPSSPAALREVA